MRKSLGIAISVSALALTIGLGNLLPWAAAQARLFMGASSLQDMDIDSALPATAYHYAAYRGEGDPLAEAQGSAYGMDSYGDRVILGRALATTDSAPQFAMQVSLSGEARRNIAGRAQLAALAINASSHHNSHHNPRFRSGGLIGFSDEQSGIRMPALPQFDLMAEAGNEAPDRTEVLTVRPGDTLSRMLVHAGVPRSEAHEASQALAEHYDLRHLRPGQELLVLFERSEDEREEFAGLRLMINSERHVAVTRDEDSFSGTVFENPLERIVVAAAGSINTTLIQAGDNKHVPQQVMLDLIELMSWEIDFDRDIKRGDNFQILYEQLLDETGVPIRTGEILYAALTLSGERHAIYFHETEDGETGHFTPDGHSVHQALMDAPVEDSWVSSHYGMRVHPILGRRTMHRGIDFAATRGTPVMASGNGTIEEIGRMGSYGNYVRIRHNDRLSTAYAHLNGFAPGMTRGREVRQGEVIAYVGSTGRSTGPHLHYEVLVDGEQVDPEHMHMPHAVTLASAEQERFSATVRRHDQHFALLAQTQGLGMPDQLASAGPLSETE